MSANEYKISKAEEKYLKQKLAKTLTAIIGITVFLVLSLAFFAPKLGVFFGFFSKYRNQEEQQAQVKPSPPIFAQIPSATKETQITLNGYSQPGYKVVIYVNGPEVENTTVGADGIFTFNGIQLIDGNNTIWARTIDNSGASSENSKNYNIVVDKEKPEITIESPKNKDTIRNLDGRVRITGKVSEKATITINDRISVLKPDLTFDFLLGVTEGNFEIKIKAVDEAGNEETETINIIYLKQS